MKINPAWSKSFICIAKRLLIKDFKSLGRSGEKPRETETGAFTRLGSPVHLLPLKDGIENLHELGGDSAHLLWSSIPPQPSQGPPASTFWDHLSCCDHHHNSRLPTLPFILPHTCPSGSTDNWVATPALLPGRGSPPTAT